ncbi:hypothetical protein [Burkholderia pseudomallei]|uniref:hypothetical protein n=1 Tax=Burkholderia pseudomallei TaxID=28450 RepID=UPI0005DA374F|nr:hypothetical protein [Burkholderia pseudomallei]AJX71489.1 type I site-specific deoxyribonuclease [Burkholderia pseudomallei MSHR840]
MTDEIGKSEKATQNRVIKLFTEQLKYDYLGDWTDRVGNNNVEEGPLSAYLTEGGCQDFRVQGRLSNYTEGRTNRSA